MGTDSQFHEENREAGSLQDGNYTRASLWKLNLPKKKKKKKKDFISLYTACCFTHICRINEACLCLLALVLDRQEISVTVLQKMNRFISEFETYP
jgi:hypothetical protein